MAEVLAPLGADALTPSSADVLAPVGAEAEVVGSYAEAGDRGALEISTRAIERIAQVAALQARGVIRQQATFGRGLPKAQAQFVEERVVLDVEVAVEWGYPLADLAAEIRGRVARTVGELTGLGVDAVSVDISAVELPVAKTSRRVV